MDDAFRQVVGVFAEELREQAARIAELILALEDAPQGPNREKHVEELFRHAHTMKGSSGALGITDVEKLAHHLEDALTPFRKAQGQLLPDTVDLALRAMDASSRRASGLSREGPESTEGQEEVLAVAELFEKHVAAGAHLAASTDASAPAAKVETPAQAPAREEKGETEDDTVRVSLSRLAAFERRLDELRTLKSRLDQRQLTTQVLGQSVDQLLSRVRSLESLSPKLQGVTDELKVYGEQLLQEQRALIDDSDFLLASADAFDDELRSLRMVSARLVVPALQRALRETARKIGKDAVLQVNGGDIDIERQVLEELKNGLTHLVRNAVDHGIEGPEDRLKANKPTRAVIELTLEERGGDLSVTMADDGRGIDVAAVRRKALEQKLITPEQAERLTRQEAYELLFRSGFSTASKVTETSGRGVGLDVVQEGITRLGGRVEVQSTAGRGTTFTIVVPMSVSSSESMLLSEAGRTFAVPHASLERVISFKDVELRERRGKRFIEVNGDPLPAMRLADVLGLSLHQDVLSTPVVAVVASATRRVAVVCDQLLGTKQLVQRPLPAELKLLDVLGSGAILPNGEAILVLSPHGLADFVTGDQAADEAHPEVPAANTTRTVLVVDDSITTRMLLRTVLTASGYRVLTATDGEEAWKLVLGKVDLVVSDVRMPVLDGFALTKRIRETPATAKLPVVLFSTLDSEEDNKKSTQSGASAFLTKRAFDRGKLVEVVESLIRGGRA